MIKTSKLLAETCNELLEADDLRDWSRLEEVLVQHFQLLGVDNDKSVTAAKYATQAFKEEKSIWDKISRKEITINNLKNDKIIIDKKVLPRASSKVYFFHFKVLETLGESPNSAYHHTMWWLQYLIKKAGGRVPNWKFMGHMYEQQRQKHGIITAVRATPNLIKAAKAHRIKNKEKQTEELRKYWDKILSSGSKAVMY